MRVTRRIEFDAGHRVPWHKSKCRNMHGHRYRLEVTVEGEVKPIRGTTDDGMVIDFGDLKQIMQEKIHDVLDHAFIVYERDTQCRAALSAMGIEHRTVVVPFIPTAENLVQWCAEQIAGALGPGLELVCVTLYETPNSWAVHKIKQHAGKSFSDQQMSLSFKEAPHA